MTTILLVLGAVGVGALLLGLLVGDLDVDIDLGPDWVSLPVLAALVGAFGFVGAATISLGAPTPVGLVAGAVAGVVLAAVVARLVKGLMHMRTDAPLRSSDLVGRPGRVVTALTAERTGEVLVSQAGQQLKVAARADETLVVGDEVVVVDVESPTLVRVESRGRFWAEPPPADPIPPTDPTPPTDPGGSTP